MTASAGTRSFDLVPLAERFRYLRFFRMGAAAAVLVVWALLPELRELSLAGVAVATGGYLLLSLARSGSGGSLKGGGGLLSCGGPDPRDGLYLAWISYAWAVRQSGALPRAAAPDHGRAARVLPHRPQARALALGAAHALLLRPGGRRARLASAVGGRARRRRVPQLIVVFIVVFWLVTLVTSRFAAVNERELRRRRYDLEALARLAHRLEEASNEANWIGLRRHQPGILFFKS